MYRHMNEQLEHEVNLPPVSERQKQFREEMDNGTLITLGASVFLRSSKRKPKEDFVSYRRGLRNAKKALKAYTKFGPEATVLINRNTMEVQ